jgi:hypothetical protein
MITHINISLHRSRYDDPEVQLLNILSAYKKWTASNQADRNQAKKIFTSTDNFYFGKIPGSGLTNDIAVRLRGEHREYLPQPGALLRPMHSRLFDAMFTVLPEKCLERQTKDGKKEDQDCRAVVVSLSSTYRKLFKDLLTRYTRSVVVDVALPAMHQVGAYASDQQAMLVTRSRSSAGRSHSLMPCVTTGAVFAAMPCVDWLAPCEPLTTLTTLLYAGSRCQRLPGSTHTLKERKNKS